MFSNIFKKASNSSTITQWFLMLIGPLRLVLLTPLVLTQYPRSDIDLMLLCGAATGFFTLIAALVPSTIAPILIYYHSGVEILGQKKKKKDTAPNWQGFSSGVKTILFTQFALIPLFIIVLYGTLYYGITTQLGEDYFSSRYCQICIYLVVGANILSLCSNTFVISLRSAGKVALENKFRLIYAIVTIFLSALLIKLGGELINVLALQLVLSFLRIFFAWIFLHRNAEIDRKSKFDFDILKFVKKPLKRATLGVTTSAGVERLTPLLLVGCIAKDNFAQFALMTNVMIAASDSSRGVVASQIPRFTKLYASQEFTRLRTDAVQRVGISGLVFTAFVLIVGPGYAFYLNLIDAKVQFPDMHVWFVLSLIMFIRLIMLEYAMLYNVTNERPFYLRVMCGGLSTVAVLLFLKAQSWEVNLVIAVVCAQLPLALCLEGAPLRAFARLVSSKSATIAHLSLSEANPAKLFRMLNQHFFKNTKEKNL